MNFPSDLIIIMLLVIVVGFVFVGSSEITLPPFKRIRFDNICGEYLKKMERNAGLSSEDIAELEYKLTDIGFQNIRVSAPRNVNWGQDMILRVDADYPFKETNVDGTKEIRVRTATFEETTIALTLDK